MLFGLSLSRSKKKFFFNKYTVHNWDLVDCLPFLLYYLKIVGESLKPARITANSEQDPIIAY